MRTTKKLLNSRWLGRLIDYCRYISNERLRGAKEWATNSVLDFKKQDKLYDEKFVIENFKSTGILSRVTPTNTKKKYSQLKLHEHRLAFKFQRG